MTLPRRAEEAIIPSPYSLSILWSTRIPIEVLVLVVETNLNRLFRPVWLRARRTRWRRRREHYYSYPCSRLHPRQKAEAPAFLLGALLSCIAFRILLSTFDRGDEVSLATKDRLGSPCPLPSSSLRAAPAPRARSCSHDPLLQGIAAILPAKFMCSST